MLRKLKPFLVVVLLALVAWGLWQLFRPEEEAPPGGFAVAVETAKAEAGILAETVSGIGSLAAVEGVVLRPEIAGRVSEILFTEGQPVEAGQSLIRIEDSVQKAALAEAEANLALAQRTNRRASNLATRGAGTEQSADEAKAGLQAATAAVELARANLAKTLISAPFKGVAGIRQVSLGDYVSPGQALVSLETTDPMNLDFRVPETLLARVAVGQKVAVKVSAYADKVFSGEVVAIDPLVDPAGRSVSLRARVANPEGLLKSGLFADVGLTLAEKPGTVFVPDTAITPMGGQNFVFRVKDGMAALTPVVLGERQLGRVVVASGLAAGDEVVTGGQIKLMMMGGAQNPMPVSSAPPPAAAP